MAYEYDVVQKNIKYLMEKAGISSVTELSRKVKMQQSTLQRMLAGDAVIRVQTEADKIRSTLP